MKSMSECPVCGAEVKLKEDTVLGELLSCGDCGTELEVKGANPSFTLAEAPQEEEDWGE